MTRRATCSSIYFLCRVSPKIFVFFSLNMTVSWQFFPETGAPTAVAARWTSSARRLHQPQNRPPCCSNIFFYLFPFSKVVWYVMIFSLCVTVLNGYFILCCDQSERIIPVLVWLVGSMIIDLSILHPLLNYTIGRYPRETHCSFCVRRRQVGQVRTPSDR